MKRPFVTLVLIVFLLLPSPGLSQVTPNDVATVVQIAKTIKDFFSPNGDSSKMEEDFAHVNTQLAEIKSQLAQITDMLHQLDAKLDEKFDNEQWSKVISDIQNINDNFRSWRNHPDENRETAKQNLEALHKDAINLTGKQRGCYACYNTAALAMAYEDKMMRFLGFDRVTRSNHIDVYLRYLAYIGSNVDARTIGFLRDSVAGRRAELKAKHDAYLRHPVEGKGTVLLDGYTTNENLVGRDDNGKCIYGAWTGFNFGVGTLQTGYVRHSSPDVIWSKPADKGKPPEGLTPPPCGVSPTFQVGVPTGADFGALNAEVAEYAAKGKQIDLYDAALKEIASYAEAAKKMKR